MTDLNLEDNAHYLSDDHQSSLHYNYKTSNSRFNNADQVGEEIVNIRTRRASAAIPSTNTIGDEEEGEAGLKRSSDHRETQEFSGLSLLSLSFQSLGVIYGDIGTSPLYVFSSTFSDPPSKRDLIGILSLVLWSLILMVTVKYICVILRADNDGEGGTFSTYALLSRYVIKYHLKNPRETSKVEMKRLATIDIENTGKRGHRGIQLRRKIEASKIVKIVLKIIGILAVTMVLSDGVLTPAQSVLGAIQGIQVAVPNISKSTIIGTTDGILILLYLIQPLGISKITIVFAPIIGIWFLLNASFGIYNLINYDATIFKAFYPYYGINYLIRNKELGWRHLGGVLLSFTGVEALFADLGAFNRKSIQISWLCFVFPCLILTYTGQASYISENPKSYSNPFFNSAPPGTLYFALVIAILAAIVASQAIITASFQLISQIMKLSYFPQLKIKHTSKKYHGQLYIPSINWLLMIGTVLVASIYNNTTSLGNAYGVCVMMVTFFDTLMVSLVAIFVWHFNPLYVVGIWLLFASLDGAFLSSALTKVPDGAWFTLSLSTILAIILLIWRFGKEKQWSGESQFKPFSQGNVFEMKSTSQHDKKNSIIPLSKINGLGIFFDKSGKDNPEVFNQFIEKLSCLPEFIIFFHLKPINKPTVSSENDRYQITRLNLGNSPNTYPNYCYRLIINYGFNDDIITPDLSLIIYNQIKNHLMTKELENQRQIQILEKAFNHKVLYIIGKEQLKIDRKKNNWFKMILLWSFIWTRENTRNRIANLNLSPDGIIEVGFLTEI
ncbi:potassium uptake protein [Kwoniella dendrophila CBS 6074]|uniref:Potassium uptake protein n=1 Tax=Kwoniella dendrophila CBS 6074 TaxID=1295534 RepID=A0AAX4K2X8_9TREE